jgi:PEP-CTERM motif
VIHPKLILGTVIFPFLAQASFITNLSTNPYNPSQAEVQHFTSPDPNLPPNANPVTGQFASSPAIGLTFTGSTAYNPNQVAGGSCIVDFGAPGPDCVTSFTENPDASYNTILGTSFTVTFVNPPTEVAFWMIFDQITGTSPMTTITLTGNNGGIVGGALPTTYSQSFAQNAQRFPWFLADLGGVPIESITLTGVGANTTVGTADGYGYGVVLAQVEIPNPEPGTVLLLGAGLGALGFVAYRRRA